MAGLVWASLILSWPSDIGAKTVMFDSVRLHIEKSCTMLATDRGPF